MLTPVHLTRDVYGDDMARVGYHHGNLRAALIDAGLAAARDGGPEAVVLREATRAAGVTVNAAYRHFDDRDDYLRAVASAALREVSLHIERVLVTDRGGRERLRSVGRGYIGFARAEPGWFRTAFLVPADLTAADAPEAQGGSGRTAFQLLSDALDQLVEEGALAPDARLGAEVAAWAAVHGFAMLALLGPLRGFPAEMLDVLADQTIDVAVRGLVG